jgi:transcriptional regulator with XRE-family HTH domain
MDTILNIRKALGVSQSEMGEMLGIHQSTLSRLETGLTPTNKRTLMAAMSLLAARATPARDVAA